jgi:hypothetical protein
MRYQHTRAVCQFDVTDVNQAAVLERVCCHLRERVARAFAQGFTAAIEGGEVSREWLEEYKEKAS